MSSCMCFRISRSESNMGYHGDDDWGSLLYSFSVSVETILSPCASYFSRYHTPSTIRVHLRWTSRIQPRSDGCDRSRHIVEMLLHQSLGVFWGYLFRCVLRWFIAYSAPIHFRDYWSLVRAYRYRTFFLREPSSWNSWPSCGHRVRVLQKTSWPWMIWTRGVRMSWIVLHTFHTLFCVVPISHPLWSVNRSPSYQDFYILDSA